MRFASHLHLSTRCKHLETILSDSLQHRKARLLTIPLDGLQQALVNKGGHPFQQVSIGVANHDGHSLNRLKGAATNKDGELPEEALFLHRQKLIAPLDGVAQGLLSSRGVPRSTCQHG